MGDGVRGARGGDEDEIVLPGGDGGDECVGHGRQQYIVPVTADLRVDDFDVCSACAQLCGEVALAPRPGEHAEYRCPRRGRSVGRWRGGGREGLR